MIKKKDLPDCPVATTLRLIDSKWKIFILQRLQERPYRHNELKKSIYGLSQKVLTDSLRSMEEDELISRKVFDSVPPRVEYSLTEIGKTFQPVLDAIEIWGNEYIKYLKERDNFD